MMKTAFFIFSILSLVTTSTVLAGFASDVTISGKVTDFDDRMFCLLTGNGIELQLPRKLIGDKVRLQPGKKLFVSVHADSFNQFVKVRLKRK